MKHCDTILFYYKNTNKNYRATFRSLKHNDPDIIVIILNFYDKMIELNDELLAISVEFSEQIGT